MTVWPRPSRVSIRMNYTLFSMISPFLSTKSTICRINSASFSMRSIIVAPFRTESWSILELILVNFDAGVTTVYVFFVFLGGSTQCLRGVLSGCGRQSDNARVSLVASYCVGAFCIQNEVLF